jgi:hypothetical protein
MKIEDWYKKTERPEERELRRKLRRQAIVEWIGLAALIPISILLFWLYLAATPPQSSAINDLEEVGTEARP